MPPRNPKPMRPMPPRIGLGWSTRASTPTHGTARRTRSRRRGISSASRRRCARSANRWVRSRAARSKRPSTRRILRISHPENMSSSSTRPRLITRRQVKNCYNWSKPLMAHGKSAHISLVRISRSADGIPGADWHDAAMHHGIGRQFNWTFASASYFWRCVPCSSSDLERPDIKCVLFLRFPHSALSHAPRT